ncbi:MAG TPA: hypothetical protein IAB28_04070 [Candidatus Copromonas faecavium]|uniref:Uncharacterized protein n=1 Tax=Candidatus Copromonas faecavium (nom. illeg.) TaxID=2840740 RepID=A0A9D1A3J6_9FIRM|nr:hypothetical protein [Candidatus Copromonas faecavium]
MSVMKANDKTELIATCSCGCEESIHLKIVPDDDSFCFLSYMIGNFYRDQGGVFSSVKIKLKKIMAILFNKDYYYSEVIMTKEDFSQFKEFINQF